MNFSSLSASDKRTLVLGAVATLVALISFVDTSGSWGGVMILALLGGLLAVFMVLQPQVAPTVKLPMTKGLTALVAGAAATAGFAIAMLSYIGYISRNITDIYVILMIVGLVASILLLWFGWQAYQAERPAAATTGAATTGAAPAAAPPAAAPPPAAPPPPPAASDDTPSTST